MTTAKYHPWMAHDEGDLFSADASDLVGMQATDNLVACPVCNAVGSFFGIPINRPLAATYPMLFAQRDSEGDITHWQGSCGCGQRLVVYND